MNDNSLNPYESPAKIGVENSQARFRLRRWFAVALYLALFFDIFAVWSFGFQPFLASICIFMSSLIASVFIRRYARIRLHETGIHYEDLVQRVDVSWDRVVRVIHSQFKTAIATSSPLAQISVSRRHEEYDFIVSRLVDIQAEFGFEISDFRTRAESAADA